MKTFSIPALVLGGGITGLGAIRSLGRTGINVYHVDDKKTLAIYSKYCKRYFIAPKISQDKEELKSVLQRVKCQIGNAAVLFPASDLYALYVSDLIDNLSSYRVPGPKREILEILINKRNFYQSLMEKNIPHPATYFPEDVQDIKKISKEISYPVFIKPYVSHVFSKRFGKKGFVASSELELLDYFKLVRRVGIDAMVQEIVPGSPTNHIFLDGYLDKNLNPKAFFVRQRLRMWPLDFGNSSLCISIPASEVTSLKETLFKYLKSIRYNGIFSAEWKKDSRDGIFKLLEINPRTSAWFNTLSLKCGVNIMLIAYLDAMEINTEYFENYKAGVKWIFLRDDLRSASKMLVNGDLSIREWIFSLLGERDYAIFAKDDLKPFLVSLFVTFLTLYNRL